MEISTKLGSGILETHALQRSHVPPEKHQTQTGGLSTHHSFLCP